MHNIANPHVDFNSLVIAGVKIRQDNEGRYCLNDCHKASGGEKNTQPSNFMRLDTTKDLVAEISRSSDLRNGAISIKQGGIYQGTYVVKELVYAYAMWISPAFNLQVIRAYDDLVMGRLKQASQTQNPLELALYTIQTLKDELEEAKPKAEALDRIATADGTLCLRDAAKALQVRPGDLIDHMSYRKWIHRREGKKNWIAYQDKIQRGYLVHKIAEIGTDELGDARIKEQVRVTAKGMARLSEIFTQEPA